MFYFAKGKEEQHINKFPRSAENTREFDYNTLIQYRSMHRIYALKYTGASKSLINFSNAKKNPQCSAVRFVSGVENFGG